MQLVTPAKGRNRRKISSVCVEPQNLGEGQFAACRYCWQCRANRVNDLVGRCIAEQEYSAATFAVTLTYAGDGPSSAVLVYADFQRFMKRLRKEGFKARYIVAGEYGSKKARAHWHAVLFFSGAAPAIARGASERQPWQILLETRFNWEPWPHGFVFFQQPDYGGFAYVLKYALKDQDADVSKGHLAMSKKPPLGDAFVRSWAARHVAQGLAPQDLFYSFPDAFDGSGRRRRFLLQGKSRENFLRYFLDGWAEVHDSPPPASDVLTALWDKQAAEERAAAQTDQEWRSRRNQWPKYQSPESGCVDHAGEFEMELRDDPANWRFEPRPLPVSFWDYAPLDLVDLAQDGQSLGEVFDCAPWPLQVFYLVNGVEKSWLVNDPETQAALRDWFHTRGAR